MGDSGSNLLGLLLAAIAIQGVLKTAAVVALFFPLVILAVPAFDATFVVAKRIKYGRPVYSADRWHLHHRFANIGFSARRTVLYLYAWTVSLAALALALRFVPYSDDNGHLNAGLDDRDAPVLRPGGRRGQRLSRARARDPQVPALARAPAAQAGRHVGRARSRRRSCARWRPASSRPSSRRDRPEAPAQSTSTRGRPAGHAEAADGARGRAARLSASTPLNSTRSSSGRASRIPYPRLTCSVYLQVRVDRPAGCWSAGRSAPW